MMEQVYSEFYDDSEAYRLAPYEYAGLLVAVNATTIERYQRLLAELPLPERSCLVVVGSDGKRERHEQSASEFRLFTTGHGVDSAAVTADLLKLISPLHIQLGPDNLLETVALDGNVPTSYAFGDPTRIYPDRSINFVRIVGSTTTCRLARMMALTEMTTDNPLGKKIRNYLRHQLSDYRKALETGEFRHIPTFSLDEASNIGIQYYNEDPNHYTVGFKSSALRAVQRQLDRYTIVGIRETGWQIDDLAEHLPTGTIHRIEWISGRGLISSHVAQRLTHAYAWFLQQYHHAQREYKHRRELVAVPFNRKMFMEHREAIRAFTYSHPGHNQE